MNSSPSKGRDPAGTRKMVALGFFAAGVALVGGLLFYFNFGTQAGQTGGQQGPAGGPPAGTPTALSQSQSVISKKPPIGLASPQPSGVTTCFCEVENNAWNGKWDCMTNGVIVSSVVDIEKCPPPTEPPEEVTCFCEVKDSAWSGNLVCVNSKGDTISSVVDTATCPPPVCGNGAIEGNEECDGYTCGNGGACKENCTCASPTFKKPLCTCVFTATASGGIQGRCAEDRSRTCTVSSP